MNVLQDILGLFKRKVFKLPKDEDVIFLGTVKKRKSGNVNPAKKEDVKLNAGLIKYKDLKSSIINSIPTPPTPSGSSVPPIKNSSIIFLAPGNSPLTAGVSQTSTKLRGIPFPVYGDFDSTGIVLQVQNTSTATLHLALYKYDYENDVWDKATEQMDINIAVAGTINQNFTSPQPLEAGLYCVGFRDSNSTGQVTGLFKHRSTNKFGADLTSMTSFYNLMQTDLISYSPTMPLQITFPSANFLENNYHEFFQIKS